MMGRYFPKLRWALLLMLWLLSGCQHSNQLALYSLSQSELNQQLTGVVSQLQQDVRLAGIPLQLQVNTLQAVIAPDGQPVIELTLQTEAVAQLLMLKAPLQLALRLRAEPYFDQQRQAVYLRQFSVVQSDLQAGRWQGKLKPLNRELAQLLQQMLAQQPVYRLDPTKFSHRALLNIPLALKLSPGNLVLSPAYR
ncbi:DUF1439 domain-containing protein [Rheinheimera riviphila]|uniref:DUF1439 domain-containing protein n=1 Tax=Rheinheimera riviphila TaxID=1834037 RepID=A0A437R039_9GAMM|nr:DUF1439 domain-containing protein [Rheinheimera riviphila]RVU40077.1 DUF1439 domain-containing protein [Rheinheimera riviphila]